KIANATVLIRDGKIAAVGTSVVVPSDATRIDAAGKWVTPGLIDGGGQMGLVEIGAVAGTRDGSLATDSVAASFNVAEGLNPASVLIPVTRIEGITTALAAPAGHLISGQAVLIDLEGATIEQMLVKSPVGLVANLSEAAKDEAGGSRAGVSARLRRLFRDALEYERRKADFNRAQMQPLAAAAPDLEALLRALLAKAGVKVVLLETDTHNARNLRQQAGNAVSYGMSWDQALRAVTLSPSEVFGVADRYGSLEPGKVANVVVWSGDPFEFTTEV